MDSFGKDSGNFLTAILNGMDCAIIATDETGTIRALNAGASEMLGYPTAELIGQHSVLVLHDKHEIAVRAAALSGLAGQTIPDGFAVIAGLAITDSAQNDEWTYLRKDGTPIPVQLRISCIRSETGSIIGYLETAHDLTTTKQHESTLLRYTQYLHELERISGLGGWEIELPSGNIFWSRQAYEILEKPHDFVPGYETMLSFYGPESASVIQKALSDCIQHGTSFEVKANMISGSGAKKYIRSKGEAVYENGRIIKVAGIFQDITQEQAAEDLLKEYALDLEKKNHELDQFAYVVSHDLKAPLRGINNLSDWIEEDISQKMMPDTRKNFVLLRKRVSRMENLINGILEYSKAGRSSREAAYFSAYELINEVVSNLTIDKNIKVNIVQPMPFLRTDKIKLEQVISNLVSNAVKYNTSAHPEILITARENHSHYSFCVSDNGPGIDPAYHQKIFVIFQTLQSRDSFENTGVGLAIVKKIVEENGGTVWVESRPGHGAKFCFTWIK